MVDSPEVAARVTFPLRWRDREVALLPGGVRHPRSQFLPGDTFTSYPDITHLAAGLRWVRLGTRSGVYLLPRSSFQHPEDAHRLVRELVARISAWPGGAEQMARMAEVEERQRMPHPIRVTLALIALCGAVFLAQLALGGRLEEVAAFGATLGRIEPWRFVTGNLLHATWVPPHLAFNLLAIFVFGCLVERPVGAPGTLFVVAVSGLAAMIGSWLAGLEGVVGASGIASGLVGSVLCLEFLHSDRLPAAWRLPRRIFVFLVVLENALMWRVPWIAVSGHLGGLVGGALATALVARPLLRGPSRAHAPGWLLVADAALVFGVAASISAAAFELMRGDDLLLRRGERLLALPHASPGVLNDTAWMIAISDTHRDEELEVALRLAERAVAESQRRNANLLDTLAEVLFQVGRADEAVATIDEAIRLDPPERYYREQRRRFTGERDFHDRPAPPGFAPPDPLDLLEDPGIRV